MDTTAVFLLSTKFLVMNNILTRFTKGLGRGRGGVKLRPEAEIDLWGTSSTPRENLYW